MLENVSGKDSNNNQIDFNNTEIAFRGKSGDELNRSYQLFKLLNNKFLVIIGQWAANTALNLGLPVDDLIKKTVFKQFCGGESLTDVEPVISALWKGKVGSILDYSVEGLQDEASFNHTLTEVIKIIKKAGFDDRIPFAVFKLSGIARYKLLEKVSLGTALADEEQAEYLRVKERVNEICKAAHEMDVSVMIDAEESWIQKAVDNLALEMMQVYNLEKAIVYNTYQLYRTDGLVILKSHYVKAETSGFILGAKLVRGAYMEKERARAVALNEPSVIHSTKEATDNDYNEALRFCVQHIKYIAFVAGTHNEVSCKKLVDLLNEASVHPNNLNVYFSQLLGMSDNLSFNLANAGYNVAKYVPYGPVKEVLPYLFRRADENSAIAGQMGRELSLISIERKRRNINNS